MSKTKDSEKPLVSVVIVNWNGINDTKECLQHLENHILYIGRVGAGWY